MKKFFICIGILFFTLFINNNSFALTSKFKFVIDTVGIPRYNAYGDEISEDVYYTYNIFSYGEPKNIKTEQRWKNSKYGFWTQNGGSYKGTGTRGEYYVIGKSYSGALIYNYYFPMDEIPTTTPDKWSFYSYPGASDSWKDKTKYKYQEQLDYMKNAKLMFNDISSRARADNPKYIKEYNITPLSIGLSKARLDAAATWKTYGTISTRRYINKTIYSQVYLVKPMAALADVKSTIDISDSFVLDENVEDIVIPIKFKTEVINMTGYARIEHIKEIVSSLYIDGRRVDLVSGSKIASVGDECMLVITRKNYPPNNYCVELKVDGYMHTEFAVDGLMQDTVTKKINILVEPKKVIPVKNSSIMVLEKDTQEMVVRPLAQNYITKSKSNGFTEAGKYAIIKFELNTLKEDIKDVHMYIDSNEIKDIKFYDSKDLVMSFKIPQNLSPTLYGEYSLRNETGNFFDVDNNLIGSRRNAPHEIRIKYKVNNKDYEEKIKFDTLDSYIKNINSKIKISTTYQEEDKISLKDWLN